MKYRKYQSGGEMNPEIAEQAPNQTVEQDPMMAIVQLFMEGLQNQNCEALAQGAQMFLELVQQAQGGNEAPAGQPVFAKGGKMITRKQASLKLVRG